MIPGMTSSGSSTTDPPIGAVIFDCDGTLVDSERLSHMAWARVLAPFGLRIGPDDRAAMVGHAYDRVHAHFATHAATSASASPLPGAAAFWAGYAATLYELIDAELAPFGDAVDAARDLHRRGVPLAVASGSGRERLDRTLARSGAAELFPVSVAGDEVQRPKPAPDGFLLAARRLGVDPEACVAVEDSAPGVAAARAAGMTTVAVARVPEDRAALAAADVVVDTLGADLLLDSVARRRQPR